MKNSTVITIGRQYGSGGREIGKRIAEKLDIPYYDKELLEISAKESGICKEFLEKHDEKATNSFLYSLVMGSRMVGMSSVYGAELPLNQRIFLAQFETIERIASQGGCVIVGRCADYILRQRKNVLKLFLYAPIEDRAKRAVELYGHKADNAEKQVMQIDKQRESYYNYFTTQRWGDFRNYDVMLDTSRLGYDNAATLIENYIALEKQ
ncbi:MAG: cytidylate kinase-like family protein [Eubacteriales bacterium]|nr:cytidylate kinase-like family protein [Eubacteriales bacterium]MDD3882725.1 cytidylate kinase-like family protein [Eubacteriales bacterium]MDD4512654.1 cytidylate kinase-like family protein [Eubacteriales bacterium]